MTWVRATPVLVIAALFDALRFMFEWFVLFGPALIGVGCGLVSGSVTFGAVCTAGAGAAALWGAAVVETFGIVMAMVTGLAGWLVVGIMLLIGNSRIFKENLLWFVSSLLVSEIPFVGSIPAITLVVWRMYHNQIKTEKAAYKKYQAEEQARLQEEQQRLGAAQVQVKAQLQAEEEIPEDEPGPA